MSMVVSFTNGTKETMYFNNVDSFRWFLGVNALGDQPKVNGYRRV